MDKQLSSNEQSLQDLLHTKNYTDLTTTEQSVVLSLITQSEYEIERQVILAAPSIFEEEPKAVPLPLIIPQTSKGVLWSTMPVYQSLLAVAVTIIFMLLIFPIHNESGSFETKTEYIVKVDTVEIEKEIYKYDTVYQTIEKPIYIQQAVYVESNSNPCINPIQEAPRLLHSNPSMNLPELTEQLTENKGTSLKDDNLSSLIVEF